MMTSRNVFLLPLIFIFMGTADLLAATSALDTLSPGSAQNGIVSPTAAPAGTQVLQKITVSGVHGEVFLRKSGDVLFSRINADTEVRMGDTVKTGDGVCELEMENHTRLVLQAGTIVQINEATFDNLSQSRATVLKLDAGRLKARIGKLSQGSKFEVLTPTALAAVRGTIFYLDAGTSLGKLFTELYVDESSGGVVFRNTKTGAEFLIPKFGASSAFQDGSILAPHFLNQRERKDFTEHWESAVKQVLGQVGIEEKPNDAKKSGSADSGSNTDDAQKDRQSEQNISGSALEDFVRRLLEALSQNENPAEWSYDSVKYDDGTSPFGEEKASSPDSNRLLPPAGPGDEGVVSDDRLTAKTAEELEALRNQERAAMRAEISRDLDRIEKDIQFDQRIAQFEKTLDAQTGKVFTDAHGYRVRVDQYIFMPSSQSVEVLSLTQRAGGPNAGISSAEFGIDFNRPITSGDGPIRYLPWNDYLNVVTSQEMAAKSPTVDGEPVQDIYSQYIVHEERPDLAQGDSALFPRHFYAEFSNPNRGSDGEAEVRDRVRFDEIYSDPMTYNFESRVSKSGDYVVQGRTMDATRIAPAVGDSLTLINRHGQVSPELYLNGDLSYQSASESSSPELVVTGGAQITSFTYKNASGSQTPGFVADFNNPDNPGLKDIEYYRNNRANDDDADPSGYNFPAFFEQKIQFEYNGHSYDKSLIGVFVPMDNAGHVLESDAEDGSGFRVHGLRDLISPNPRVNGGNYNLEVIFSFGDLSEDLETHKDTFTQNFGIDTIITPEIFNGTGAFDTMNRSEEFPASLDDSPTHKENDVLQVVGD